MPRLLSLVAVVVIVALGLFFWTGSDRVVQIWALEGQQDAQNAMARALRALRAGEPAALWSLMAVCFGYGFFHAVGPGHGKLLIGGYGAARAVGAAKLSAVALASSLAQAGTAIVLVGGGLWIWGLSRVQMTDMADRLFAPLSFGAIALVGLWLVWRGLRGWQALSGAGHGHGDHHHHHAPGEVCPSCGHAHAPAPEQIAAATGWRDIAALIGAVAIRPCTGALFLLILTAQMGIFAIGVAGTVAMALGTASVTVAVAIGAVTLRRGALAGLLDTPGLVRAQPALEIAIGALVALVAGQLALAALPG
jgi:ABC-type nickel/cobalt efflux system permease component RcnA